MRNTVQLRVTIARHLLTRLKRQATAEGIGFRDLVILALESRVPPAVDSETGQQIIFLPQAGAAPTPKPALRIVR